jgi:hypothetical protein
MGKPGKAPTNCISALYKSRNFSIGRSGKEFTSGAVNLIADMFASEHERFQRTPGKEMLRRGAAKQKASCLPKIMPKRSTLRNLTIHTVSTGANDISSNSTDLRITVAKTQS